MVRYRYLTFCSSIFKLIFTNMDIIVITNLSYTLEYHYILVTLEWQVMGCIKLFSAVPPLAYFLHHLLCLLFWTLPPAICSVDVFYLCCDWHLPSYLQKSGQMPDVFLVSRWTSRVFLCPGEGFLAAVDKPLLAGEVQPQQKCLLQAWKLTPKSGRRNLELGGTWIEWLREAPLLLQPFHWFGILCPLLHTSAQCSAGSKRKCDPVYGRLDWEYKEESDLGSLGVARALGGFSIR